MLIVRLSGSSILSNTAGENSRWGLGSGAVDGESCSVTATGTTELPRQIIPTITPRCNGWRLACRKKNVPVTRSIADSKAPVMTLYTR